MSNTDLSEIFGFVPNFIECSECGQKTTISPCFDCDARRERERDERADLMRRRDVVEKHRNFPARHLWADLTSELLAKRVKTKRGLDPVDVALIAKSGEARTILFRGDSGTGKTSLAVAIARSVVDGTFIRCTALGNTIAAAQKGGVEGKAASEWMKWIGKCSLLVLDEFGDEHPFHMTWVRDVVMGRDQNGQRTILTTFRSPYQLADHYGAGMLTRLTEHKRGLVVEFGLPTTVAA